MSGEDAPQSTSTHDSMEERDRPEQGDLSGTDASVHVVPEKEIQSEEAQQGDGAPDADGSFKSANLNASAETEDENTTEQQAHVPNSGNGGESYWPEVSSEELASPDKSLDAGQAATLGEQEDTKEVKESANLTPTLTPVETDRPPAMEGEGATGEETSPTEGFASLEQAVKLTEAAHSHTRDAVHFFKRRAQIEEAYARALKLLHEEATASRVVSFRSLRTKLQGRSGDEVGERAGKAWGAMLAQLQGSAELHHSLAERLSKGAAAPLKKAADEAETVRREVDKEAGRLQRELRDAQKRVERAAEAADRAAQAAVLQAAGQAAPAKPASAGEKVLSFFKKAPQGPEAIEAEKCEAARRCNEAQQLCHANAPTLLSRLAGSEAARLSAMHAALADATAAMQGAALGVHGLCPAAAEAVAAMDAAADSNDLLAAVRGNGAPKAL